MADLRTHTRPDLEEIEQPIVPGGRRPSRRRSWPLVVAGLAMAAIAVGTVVVLTQQKSTTKKSTLPPVSATQPTTAATQANTSAQLSAVVLSAYLADQKAWQTVAATYPVEPTDPRLAASLTGAELSAVRLHLSAESVLGQVGVGMDRIAIKPTVTALTDTTATVTACVTDNSQLIKKATGAVVSTGPGGPYPWTATMLLTDGYWKIATDVQGGPAC